MLFPALFSFVSENARDLIRRNLHAYIFYGVAILAVIGAIVFGLDALRVVLIENWGPVYADLAIAGGLLAVAAILAIIGTVVRRRRRVSTALSAATAVGVPLAVAALSRRNSTSLVLIGAAFIGGILLGRPARKG